MRRTEAGGAIPLLVANRIGFDASKPFCGAGGRGIVVSPSTFGSLLSCGISATLGKIYESR